MANPVTAQEMSLANCPTRIGAMPGPSGTLTPCAEDALEAAAQVIHAFLAPGEVAGGAKMLQGRRI